MTLVFIFVPIIMKKVVWKKLLSQLDNEQYDEFYKTLDSNACKFSYQAFNREYMRLSGYLAQRNDAKIEEQFDLLKNMRISNKQKASVASRGFYYYLEKGKIKKAEGDSVFLRFISMKIKSNLASTIWEIGEGWKYRGLCSRH